MLARLTPAQKFVLVLSAIVLVVGVLVGHRLGDTADDGGATERIEYTLPDAGDVKVTVHVVGAVARPGLYALSAGSRIRDAIVAAGGFRTDADPESVNLAAFVDDGDQVRVEAKKADPQPRPQPDPTPPPRPSVETSDAPPARSITRAPAASQGGPPASSGHVRPQADDTLPEFARQRASERICLNSAGLQELQQLPGIGPELAKKIIYHRTMNGPFRSPEDLHAVPGIGPATVERLRTSARVN